MDVADQVFLHKALHLLGVVIFFYDWLLTLPAEVKHIWARPRTIPAGFFFLNRYFNVISNALSTVTLFVDLSLESCKRYTHIHNALFVICLLIVLTILIMRVYALYDKSRRVLLFVLVVMAVLFCVAIFGLVDQAGPQQQFGCLFGADRRTALRTSIAWWALFLMDALVFAMTLYRTFNILRARVANTRPAAGQAIITVLIRDGAAYFFVMGLSTVANIGTFYSGLPFVVGSLTSFVTCISATLCARMILNLYATARAPLTILTDTDFDFASGRSRPARPDRTVGGYLFTTRFGEEAPALSYFTTHTTSPSATASADADLSLDLSLTAGSSVAASGSGYGQRRALAEEYWDQGLTIEGGDPPVEMVHVAKRSDLERRIV